MIAKIHSLPALTDTYISTLAADNSSNGWIVHSGSAEPLIGRLGAVKAQPVLDPSAGIEVLATIRGWKDGF